jgi:putative hydrolase of the HAD superfamily
MPLRAVLFDLGDTLWRHPGAVPHVLLRQYERACSEFGPWEAPATAVMEAVGAELEAARDALRDGTDGGRQPPTPALVERALRRLGVGLGRHELLDFTHAVFSEVELARLEPPEPENAAALSALRDRGLRVACVSNAFGCRAILEGVLRARGLEPFVELTISSADVGYRKPHPLCFRAALDPLGLSPEECLFVGDRLDTDIEGAAGLGMTAVLTHQYRREDPGSGTARPAHVVSHLGEVVALADARLA